MEHSERRATKKKLPKVVKVPKVKALSRFKLKPVITAGIAAALLFTPVKKSTAQDMAALSSKSKTTETKKLPFPKYYKEDGSIPAENRDASKRTAGITFVNGTTKFAFTYVGASYELDLSTKLTSTQHGVKSMSELLQIKKFSHGKLLFNSIEKNFDGSIVEAMFSEGSSGIIFAVFSPSGYNLNVASSLKTGKVISDAFVYWMGSFYSLTTANELLVFIPTLGRVETLDISKELNEVGVNFGQPNQIPVFEIFKDDNGMFKLAIGIGNKGVEYPVAQPSDFNISSIFKPK